MIKCSHLTPKSIYSYIVYLVIANFLIDPRIGCACLTHSLFAILLCEHVGLHILSIRGHPFVVLFVLVFLAKWMYKSAQAPLKAQVLPG